MSRWRVDRTGSRDIWVVDAARGTSMKLTFGGANRTPHWSRDGKTLYYITYDRDKQVSWLDPANSVWQRSTPAAGAR